MFTRCELCRYFTQVIYQTLSMDVKLPIKFLLTFFIIAGCAAIEDKNSLKKKSINSYFPPSCISKVLGNDDVRKPLRARFFSRTYYKIEMMEGCIDTTTGKSIPNAITEEKHVNPITYKCLIQLSQQLSPKLDSKMNMRLDVYAERKYYHPVDIVLILHSMSGYTWTLNVANLATSVLTEKISTMKIIFTHKESKLALEQIQLPKWRLTVDHVKPNIENLKSFNDISKWAEEDFFKGVPLNMTVNFPSRFSHNSKTATVFDIVNTIDLTLPAKVQTDSKNRKICADGKNSRMLSNWTMGMIDVNIDDGFTSCHTENLWTPAPKPLPSSKPKSIKLLQSIQVADKMIKTNFLNKEPANIQLRVQTLPPSQEGNNTYVLVILNKLPNVEFYLDLRGLHGKLFIHTNKNQTLVFNEDETNRDYEIEVDTRTSTAEEFIENVMKRHDPGGIDPSTWQVERVRITRIPTALPNPGTIRRSPLVIYLDVSLSTRPLKVGDLENLVDLQCFNTEDVSISLNARTFENVGLKREWVRLGKERCLFSESSNGRQWVRKLLLRSGRKKCGTQKSHRGENVSLTNKIYIIRPLNVSRGLSPYPLIVQCDYATSSHDDLPTVKENPSDKEENETGIWSTWDGKSYKGPRPSKGSRRDIKMELFTDSELSDQVIYTHWPVRSGQELYARLQPTDETANYGLLVRDCYLSNAVEENHPLGYPRQYLIIKGCDMGVGFRWTPIESYRIKTFAFQLPRLSFFSMSPYIHLHCNVQPCNYAKPNKAPGDLEKGLPNCWSQNYLCQVTGTPASTHVVSMTLKKSGDETDAMDSKVDLQKHPRNPKSIMKTIPLWGAVMIATIAFFLGILFTCIMWFIHQHSGGHCDVGDRLLNRRRHSRDHRHNHAGSGRNGNKSVNSRQIARAPHCQQYCLHRLMPHNYLDDRHGIISENGTDEAVARLLATRAAMIGDGGAPHHGGKGDEGLYDSQHHEPGSRVKNSHSISCTVCGEGSSSGFGTGNCSSCSAQTCSLGDETEAIQHLSPELHGQHLGTSDYPQEEMYSPHFASA